MKNMKTTTELLKILKTKDNYEEVIETQPTFIESTLSEYLEDLIERKNLKKVDVICKSGFERSYAYQIFSGKKIPSRDKLLTLAFGMKLTFEEVQDLLRENGYAELYPKNKRDNIIIFALYKGQSVLELNESLLMMNEELLI